MSWFSELIEKIEGEKPPEWKMLRDLPDPEAGKQSAVSGNAFVDDEYYVEVWFEGFRLANRRRWATTFVPSTYASATLSRDGSDPVTITRMGEGSNVISVQDRDRVIAPQKRVLPAVPWTGGVLSLTLAVFAVRTGNVVESLLRYVTKVASKAGFSVAAVVDPFVPLITEGLDLIAGSREDTQVEIAYSEDLSLMNSEIFAIVAAEKSDLDQSRITLDPSDRKLLLDGSPLDAGYLVFSIRRTNKNADWGSIAPIREAWGALEKAAGHKELSADALAAFRVALAFSPDLTEKDKKRLLAKAEAAAAAALPADGIALQGPQPVPAFEGLDLYDEQTTRP